jgi:hypothetical protein
VLTLDWNWNCDFCITEGRWMWIQSWAKLLLPCLWMAPFIKNVIKIFNPQLCEWNIKGWQLEGCNICNANYCTLLVNSVVLVYNEYNTWYSLKRNFLKIFPAVFLPNNLKNVCFLLNWIKKFDCFNLTLILMSALKSDISGSNQTQFLRLVKSLL